MINKSSKVAKPSPRANALDVELLTKVINKLSGNYQKVLGYGKLYNPKYFVIGGIPDADEIKYKQPFVGYSGYRIKKWLSEADYDINDVYYTSSEFFNVFGFLAFNRISLFCNGYYSTFWTIQLLLYHLGPFISRKDRPCFDNQHSYKNQRKNCFFMY